MPGRSHKTFQVYAVRIPPALGTRGPVNISEEADFSQLDTTTDTTERSRAAWSRPTWPEEPVVPYRWLRVR